MLPSKPEMEAICAAFAPVRGVICSYRSRAASALLARHALGNTTGAAPRADWSPVPRAEREMRLRGHPEPPPSSSVIFERDWALPRPQSPRYCSSGPSPRYWSSATVGIAVELVTGRAAAAARAALLEVVASAELSSAVAAMPTSLWKAFARSALPIAIISFFTPSACALALVATSLRALSSSLARVSAARRVWSSACVCRISARISAICSE
mmetsp:Transcript_79307/g.157693  ORF Transcript_79307/g.157693 Transcript_79307/m.157693 type:complete len:212 (-) Transcript_79307:133-768(-)